VLSYQVPVVLNLQLDERKKKMVTSLVNKKERSKLGEQYNCMLLPICLNQEKEWSNSSDDQM